MEPVAGDQRRARGDHPECHDEPEAGDGQPVLPDLPEEELAGGEAFDDRGRRRGLLGRSSDRWFSGQRHRTTPPSSVGDRRADPSVGRVPGNSTLSIGYTVLPGNGMQSFAHGEPGGPRRWERDQAMANVRTRRDGPVLVVTIDRPERRNAVDAATASALADAFRAFDADGSLSIAVLTGAGGTFCAGADLKALAAGEVRPISEHGDGPMGPTRLRLSKPVIAAVEGFAVAG